MDDLRLWLLLIGVVFIAAVYGWGKFQERRAARRDGFELVGGAPESVPDDEHWHVGSIRAERGQAADEALDGLSIPVLNDVVTPGTVKTAADARAQEPVVQAAPEASSTPSATPVDEATPKAARELIVVLGVTAGRSREFNGPDLQAAFQKAGLYYGDMNIYHAPVDMERVDGPRLFSVANMVEPGTLEPEKLKLLTTPGLFLFTRLPGPVNGLETFDHLHATARFLARELGGEVCDERRQPITPEKIMEIRTRIHEVIGEAVEIPED